MLSKEQHIEYWRKQSDMDWERAVFMMGKKDFVFALFCVHLSLEKLAKALWIKQNEENFPPRIHNVKYLLADAKFDTKEEQAKLIDDIQRYAIEGRYPDYKLLIYKYTTENFALALMKESEKLKKCLLETISLNSCN